MLVDFLAIIARLVTAFDTINLMTQPEYFAQLLRGVSDLYCELIFRYARFRR